MSMPLARRLFDGFAAYDDVKNEYQVSEGFWGSI